MTFPSLTAFYGALFGLLYLAISIWVVMGRGKFRVHHGDGGEDVLNRRIRAHANFAEYIPVILILVALFEAGGATRLNVQFLLLPLLIARVLHPIGMIAPIESKQQIIFRGLPMLVTWLTLAAVSVQLLVRAL